LAAPVSHCFKHQPNNIAFVCAAETNVWEREVLSAPGGLGLNAISWAPGVPSASLVDHSQTSRLIKRFVTGGCDGRVRIWTYVKCRSPNADNGAF
jgi:hypothetical protein